MKSSVKYIIGIDEVGRGPLAGPVTVCAFLFLQSKLKILQKIGARDSKVLSEQKREVLAKKITSLCRDGLGAFKIVSVSSGVIDNKGINKAISIAIHSALKRLAITPAQVDIYLDGGLKAPTAYFRQHTIIKGDTKIPVISCASILAKVHRDHLMVNYDRKFPKYDFFSHKGYGTPDHYKKIRKYGISPIHRKSFLKSL